MAFPSAKLLHDASFTPMTRSTLTRGLREAGVLEGGVLMVHVRLSAFGWVTGGIDTVVHALLDAVGPDGTLMAFCGWDDSPYHLDLWPQHWRTAYDEQPPFDPANSSSRQDFGRFPERLRTWRGALRSTHPEVSFTAVGPAAPLLLTGEPTDPWGTAGPLGQLVAADGQVLLLGAPLDTLTLCHHAEAVADVPTKRRRTYRMPTLLTGWRDYTTIDTFYGVFPYSEDHPISHLATVALDAGAGKRSTLDRADVHLFAAQPTVTTVTAYLERRFGAPSIVQ
jgi:aminoglycoside 3-N-acetyltransferase